MNRLLFFRLLICFLFSVVLLYLYVNKQNEITKIRMEIPRVALTLRELEEENVSLSFVVESFESSANLMELASLPEYKKLHYPTKDSLLIVDLESEELSLNASG